MIFTGFKLISIREDRQRIADKTGLCQMLSNRNFQPQDGGIRLRNPRSHEFEFSKKVSKSLIVMFEDLCRTQLGENDFSTCF